MGGDAYINKLIDNKLKSTNDTISVLNQNLSDLNNYVKSICKTRVLIGSYSVNDASNVTVGSLEGYLFFVVEMYSSESKFAHSFKETKLMWHHLEVIELTIPLYILMMLMVEILLDYME